MNRKLLALLMIFALVISVTGCGKKMAPTEMLKAATEKAMEMTSAEQDMTLSLSIDPGEDNTSMIAMYADFIKDLSVEMHSKTVITDEMPQLEMTGGATASGMTFNFELYMNEEQMAMKVPMAPNYFVQEITSEMAESMDMEMSKSISKKVYDIIFDGLTDEDIVVAENVEKTINDANVKVTTLTLSFDDEGTKGLIKNLLITLMTDDEFIDMMVEQQEAMGESVDKEEIKSDLADAAEEIEADWDQVDDYITVDEMELVFAIDSDNQMVGSDVNLKMTVNDPMSGTPVGIELNTESTTYNINEALELTFPEITDENSQPFDALLSGF